MQKKYKDIYDATYLDTNSKILSSCLANREFLIEVLKKFKSSVLSRIEDDSINVKKDVLYETSNKKLANRELCKETLKQMFKVSPYATCVALTIIAGFISSSNTSLIIENKEKYQVEIDDYNKRLDEYIENLNLDGLTDLEIIMLLTDDIWNTIEGYGSPDLNVYGFDRLDVYPGSTAVCRNMADDLTAKLNAINPEYNARNLILYADTIDWQRADVDIKYSNDYIMEKEILSTIDQESTSNKKSFYRANHMVTLVDIPNRDIILVIDPTNAGIGIYKNGNIKMFNDSAGEFKLTRLNSFFLYGFSDAINFETYNLRSYNFKSLEELEKEFGLEAQNKALENVRKR